MTPDDVGDAWDFYICLVDDAPASIFMNFWFEDNRPPAPVDTLYYVGFQILDEGPHGMGAGKEAETLNALEDRVTAAAVGLGLFYVGRIRNNGDWQLCFYGEPDQEAALEDVVLDELNDADRGYRTGSQADPEWRYYHEFLLPDAERRRWIMNRRVVEQLSASGDALDKARRVDHWAYFSKAADRDAFLAAVGKLGFAPDEGHVDDGGDISARIHRVDSVELEHIHDTIMKLEELASTHHGDYDGWETSVEGGD